MGQVNRENFREVIAYHDVDDEQILNINNVKDSAGDFIEAIFANVPECADRTVAIRKVREAVHDAVGAIALKGQI